MVERKIRIGDTTSWVELARADEGEWRVTADWCSTFTADFAVCLTDGEVADFATRTLTALSKGGYVSTVVTEGRNNPLKLGIQPVEDFYAVFARLTRNGDDEVCQLQLEMGPVDAHGLRDALELLHLLLTP
ncbi:hypothetical protein ACGFX4_30515 [Kitasatospora sp. NPDC048365]|uniref:hypothetical protein n=1 Tax=Kitasatospora sp. NPDC048365 TaxID=3364050 RepID=UPI00371E5433